MTVRQLDQALKKANENNTDESSIPLVNLTPDINAIKSNSFDINPQKNNNVASMLVPEDAMTEYSNELPNNPIESSNINTNQLEPTNTPEPVNKFFNPLESEPANMNINDAFSVDSVFDSNPTNNVNNSNNNDIEIFDMPSNTPETTPVEPMKEQDNNDFISSPLDDLNPNNKFFQSYNNQKEESLYNDTKEEPIINPMSYVETLDDNYNETQEKAFGIDLNSIISDVRNLVKSLQAKGANIKIDEADLTDNYQINISINKNN
jgi:hypothetical protein